MFFIFTIIQKLWQEVVYLVAADKIWLSKFCLFLFFVLLGFEEGRFCNLAQGFLTLVQMTFWVE